MDSFFGINGERGSERKGALNNNARQLYLEKLLDINNMDPYDLQLQNGRKHYQISHTLTLSITWFMVSVTVQEFRSFKLLEAYEQFCKTYKPTNCESSVKLEVSGLIHMWK
jgi:hypothetical protein